MTCILKSRLEPSMGDFISFCFSPGGMFTKMQRKVAFACRLYLLSLNSEDYSKEKIPALSSERIGEVSEAKRRQ